MLQLSEVLPLPLLPEMVGITIATSDLANLLLNQAEFNLQQIREVVSFCADGSYFYLSFCRL